MINLQNGGNPNINLPETHFDNLDFSFSGIKTAILNLYHKNPEINKADLCASFEKASTNMLLANTEKAIRILNIKKLALAGGVSANSYIREQFKQLGEKENIEVYYPKPTLCTDNAAMIASAGYYYFKEKKFAKLDLNAVPNLKIGE